jgi:hypothetical protein
MKDSITVTHKLEKLFCDRSLSEEIDRLFDEWVKDGTCIVANDWSE